MFLSHLKTRLNILSPTNLESVGLFLSQLISRRTLISFSLFYEGFKSFFYLIVKFIFEEFHFYSLKSETSFSVSNPRNQRPGDIAQWYSACLIRARPTHTQTPIKSYFNFGHIFMGRTPMAMEKVKYKEDSNGGRPKLMKNPYSMGKLNVEKQNS